MNRKLCCSGAVVCVLLTFSCVKKDSSRSTMREAPEREDEVLIVEAPLLAEPASVEEYIARHYSDTEYGILKIIPSNVLPDVDEEYLVFLEDLHATAISTKSKPVIDDALCVYIEDGIMKEHLIPTSSIGYDRAVLMVILPYESVYGEWLDYCYLPDLDGDGIQELVTFNLSGIGFGKSLWKFQDGEFQRTEYEDLGTAHSDAVWAERERVQKAKEHAASLEEAE